MWRRALSHPRSSLFITLLGVLLILPSIRAGLIGDDFLFRELITGQARHAHPGTFFGLYTFADGQAEHTRHLKEIGIYQWWTADHARMTFWRPLSELSHWLDYQLWPDSPLLMHVHSLFWYALLLWLFTRCLRMLDGNSMQTSMAALLFAVSPMHLFTVIWLAARNQLIAACFILATLMTFHLWRQGKGIAYGVASLLSMVAGLMAAEATVAVMGYLLAYVLTLESHRSPAYRRFAALLPFVIVLLGWRLIYNQLGYGSENSGGYIDPGVDPWRFTQAMLLRLPALLLAKLFGASSTVFQLLPDQSQTFYAVGALTLIALSVWVGRSYRIWADPLARFWGLGALLALIPVCAAAANDRLLLNAELGLSAVLAMLFRAAWVHRHPLTQVWRKRVVARPVVLALMLVHLLVFPIAKASLAITTPSMLDLAAQVEPLSLPNQSQDPTSQVILINPPKALFVGYYPVIRRYFGLDNAASMQALTSGDQTLHLTVLDSTHIRLRGDRGLGESVSRDFKKLPFKVGDSLAAGDFHVTVEAVTASGNASQVVFEFNSPLTEKPWQLFAWGDHGYAPFTLPAPGQSVTLPPADVGKVIRQQLKKLF